VPRDRADDGLNVARGKAVAGDRVAPGEHRVPGYVFKSPPDHEEGLRQHVLGSLHVRTPYEEPAQRLADLGDHALEPSSSLIVHGLHDDICPARHRTFHAPDPIPASA